MTLAEELWQANQDLAIASLQTAFVQGLGDGSLPRDKFAYYIGQDAFFLEAFARAYSVAAAKSLDWDSFNTFHELGGGVLQELKLHHHYAAQWQVEIQAVKPGGATRRYTDFLMATAWSQDVGLIAIAMLPCMKLYAFLGQTLAQSGIPDHAYADWIRTYSSDEFTPLVRRLEALVERYGKRSPVAQSTYRYAMQCEVDFFLAAWETV